MFLFRRWTALIALPLLFLARDHRLSFPPGAASVAVTPDNKPRSATAHSTGWSEVFTVKNTGTVSGSWDLSCTSTGQVTCGTVIPDAVDLDPSQTTNVTVNYSTGNLDATAKVKLVATGPAVDTGSIALNVGTSVVRIVSPGVDTVTSRIVISNRQPVVRALFLRTAGAAADTTATVLKWRDVDITNLARHNRGLLEWEVDSTRWLGVGDSAKITIIYKAGGITTTENRWAVLLNDDKPVIGFQGMPLATLNGGFSSGFGPGFSVQGAEVETGIGAIPYVSMGVSRSAGLVYSTRTSYPRALVNVDLETPWPAGTPTQIKLYLWDAGVKVDSLVLASTSCVTGAVKRCRATLQGDFSGSTFSTPTRKRLAVEALVTSGGTTKSAMDTVEVMLVDRRATQYGSGWWPSGISKLVAAGQDRILVGPSGSATIFRGNGDSLYLAPPGSFTTLVKTGTGWEIRPRGSTARVYFDTNGRLVATADNNGNRDSVFYASTTDTVTSLKDPIGKTITFTYTSGRLSKITTLTGGAARDVFVNIDGTSNQLTYARLPYTVSSNTALRDTVRFTYQSYPGTKTQLITHRIGLIGDTTRLVYDSTFKRRPVQVFLPRVQDETGSNVTPDLEYFAYERQGWGTLRSLDSVYVEVKDPRDHWTRSLLNRWAQARTTWDALGTLGRTEYDADGFVLWSEGAVADSGRVYTRYDTLKRVVRTYTILTGGTIVNGDSLIYDSNHRVIKRINPWAERDTMGYTANGNLTYHMDADNKITTTLYNSTGTVDKIILSGDTSFIQHTYDNPFGNRSRVERISGDSTLLLSAFYYDQYGRDSVSESKIVSQVSSGTTNWQWRRSLVFLSPLNQVDSTILLRTDNCADPCLTPPSWPSLPDTTKAQHVRYRRDRGGRDSLRLNDRNQATRYVHDRLGRLLARYPDSTSVRDSMVYDVAGNLKKTITRRGHTIENTYDSRNRTTLTTLPGIGDRTRVYGGPAGQLTRIYDASPVDSIGGVNREMRWGYDNRGFLTADTSYTSTTARSTTYAYDRYGRDTSMTDPSGIWRTSYSQKFGGLPIMQVTPFGDSVIYLYDEQRRPQSVTVRSSGPAQVNRYAFNDRGRLDSVAHSVATSPNAFTPLTYFAGTAGDPSLPGVAPSYAEQHGAAASVETLTDSVGYDGWGRVLSWVGKRGGTVVGRDTFAFDRMGNIKTTAGAETYNALGRLTSRTAGGWTYTYYYDAAGNPDSVNQVSGGTTHRWRYGWDVLNRLESVRRNGTLIARYSYDVLGRRIAKRVYSSATGGAADYTRFVYHGSHVAFEADSGSGSGIKITRRYVWGMGTDDLVAVRDSTSGTAVHYYAVKDKLGSVRGLVKRDGTWQYSERFGPYGASVELSGTDPGHRYRWTGREYDAETGFYYFRARYYEPAARRFISEDPIGYAGGGNLYAYVRGAVLEARDPSGLMMQYDQAAWSQYYGWMMGLLGRDKGDGWWDQVQADISMMDKLAAGEVEWIATIQNADGSTSEVNCRSMQGACDDWLDNQTQPLSEEERKGMGNMCTSRPDSCDKIRVYRHTGNVSITLGHLIALRPDHHNDRFTLVHETYHVFQFEDWGGFKYYARGLWTQFKNLFADQYHWTPGKAFSRYGMEQQAEIVAFCVVRRDSEACAISPFF